MSAAYEKVARDILNNVKDGDDGYKSTCGEHMPKEAL